MSHPGKDSQNSIPLPLFRLMILLGEDSGFCDAMENGASVDRLNIMVRQAADTVGFQFATEKSQQQAYLTILSKCGRFNNISSGNLHVQQCMQLLRARQAKTKYEQKSRHNYAKRIGMIVKEPSLAYPSNLKVVKLTRLSKSDTYPPFRHHILEKQYDPLPPPPKRYDRSCSYSDKYHVLDESRLQYTIGKEESAVILDFGN